MNSLRSLEKPKSKNVIKPILDSPFVQQNFPEISESTSNSIKDFLLHNLQSISHYSKAKNTKGFQKDSIEIPQFYNSLTIGFNATVSQLENQVQINQQTTSNNDNFFLKYVFVCKQDTKPQVILQHIPSLVYLSSPESFKVKLITLPRGTLNQIKLLLGTNTTIIGMKDNLHISQDFKNILDTVNDVEIEWLKDFKFKKARVKMIQTTMPLGKKVKVNKILKKSKNIKRKT